MDKQDFGHFAAKSFAVLSVISALSCQKPQSDILCFMFCTQFDLQLENIRGFLCLIYKL